MVDIDGVLSLFGPAPAAGQGEATNAPGPALDAPRERPGTGGSFHSIDGIPHFISSTAAAHLLALAGAFDLVWASGWEEKANEYLPRLLGLPAPLPFLRFSRAVGQAGQGRQDGRDGGSYTHWKLASIEAYAGARALAWIDDALDAACHAWARARGAPTLLVSTAPERGLTSREAELLLEWARGLPAS